MNAIVIKKNKIILDVTKEELGVLSNALNEVCNGIEVLPFESRIGVNVEQATNILHSLNLIYKKTNQDH